MIPGWLFDELADAVADPVELRARLEAWSRLLAGFDLDRYRELRAVGVGSGALGSAVRSGHWKTAIEIDPHAACRQPNGYACASCTAQRLGVSRQRLAAMRKRGEIESIGLAPSEYRAAREQGDASGWGPGVFYRVP